MTDSMINRVLNGRYKLTERVGIGGMAEVYLAQDTVLGRIVAVKIMLPQYAADESFTARFRQEAASAANLQSPYIVNIYDWGQDQGTYFIVMEYIHGSDLKTGIKERGAINQRKVAEIGVQVCQALTVAHNLDITHRDIKPQNIMVQPDGNVKVMDFGIATAKNSMISQTSSVLGTAHYISPEQAQGKSIGAASDLYSLGVVLYEASTGKLPFDGPDAVSVALKQVNEIPLPPHKINPTIDPVLEGIIMKAMSKDPRDRYATAADMRVALSDFLMGKSSAQTQVINSGEGLSASETVVMGAAAAPLTVPNIGADGKTGVMPGGIQSQRGQQRMNRGQGQYGYNGRPTGGGMRPASAHNTGDIRMNMSGNIGRVPYPEKKSHKGLVIGIIIAVIAVIAGVIIAINLLSGPTIPNVNNKTLTQATNLIEKAGYVVGTVTEEFSEDVPQDCVISTSPAGGTAVKEGTKVNIVVSKGAELVAVPNILGMTNSEAIAELEKAGFIAKAGDPEYSVDYKADTVMSQTPAAKSQAAKGSEVTYVISKGTEIVEVPSVVGKSQQDAINTLKQAGLIPVVQNEYDDTYEEGKVFKQSPSGGKENKGESVYIYVSRGADKSTVPTGLIGQSVSSVEGQLSNAGFYNLEKSGTGDKCTGVTVDGSNAQGKTISKSSRIVISCGN